MDEPQPVAQQSQQPMMNNSDSPAPSPKQSKRMLIALIILVVIIGVGIGGYVLGTKNPQPAHQTFAIPTMTPMTQETPTSNSLVTAINMDNWKIYKNDKLSIAFAYPADWFITTTDKKTPLDLCDLNSIIPTIAPLPNTKFKACEGSDIKPAVTIVMDELLDIRPESSTNQDSPAIQVYYYENSESLSIQNFNDRYLSWPVAGDPINIWLPTYKKVTNKNGVMAYYDKEHYCTAMCQVYVWAQADKIFILKNFPTNAENQDQIFHQVFSSVISNK